MSFEESLNMSLADLGTAYAKAKAQMSKRPGKDGCDSGFTQHRVSANSFATSSMFLICQCGSAKKRFSLLCRDRLSKVVSLGMLDQLR